jgi:Fe2+ or Zn2+ uptake regulation protein
MSMRREKHVARGINKRSTRQLAAVYNVVRKAHTHPSADEIYVQVRKLLPRISLGTVYRNLQRLGAEGRVRMLLLQERVARYDAVLTEHDHFVCQQCGRIEDIKLERDRQVNFSPLRDDGFTVVSHSLAIYGLCQRCGKGSQKNNGEIG